MHYAYTRSGLGPAPAPQRAAEPVRLPITYYVPTPAWMRADGIETRPMLRTDLVGYRCYLVRQRHGL